ncbi:MAG: sigma 54-interacting transcriptional regulator [Deltaproteobacteria bacterium]|nr:sigma 54-interacting transcriptional regulator [Deltaproteobacteria bacterium]MBT4642999.1 sigma 54-interacting transcriptional regulator [Deltaproteobacteria bacterium]MBT6499216.1 sigma 54-interacting transcriptional regulator [Deltaproteobacteria bacterium]MBT7154222.1 sigma 54-interacting transcriptional regulator [Deltaproteobacteria bacterium]
MAIKRVDTNRFFRETALPLSENLDLEDAAPKCLVALSSYMPADSLIVYVMEPSLKSSRTIVSGDIQAGSQRNLIVSLTAETQNQLKKDPLPDLRIINRPELDPVSVAFVEAYGNDYSNLVMFLYRNGKRFGIVVLTAEERDKYTEADLELFSLLREPFTLALNNYMQIREISKLRSLLHEEVKQQNPKTAVKDVIGHNFGLRHVMNLVQHVAPLDSPVLLLGETGVGKELIASAIHSTSSRADGPFIKVNCGAIPEGVVDSELFGHEKGAFTGAAGQRQGRFERADQGTIFLDEVGELKPDIQVKLLRVLQNGEIERVGGSKQIQLDVRIIAATHRNLESMIREEKFREDLWFRINVFPILIPPLRTRKEDIPALVDYFINKKSKDLKIYPPPVLDHKAIDRLIDYEWRGNVRELENIIEREMILCKDRILSFNEFNLSSTHKKISRTISVLDGPIELDEVVGTHIQRILLQTEGKIYGPKGAAKILDVHPNTLRNRMDRLGIAYKKK